MKLQELMSLELLSEQIREGYVRAARHPSLPLSIYNYTEKTQFSQHWNDVTRQTRGLIVHDNGDVVARPFEKFFNYGERGLHEMMSLDEPVYATDKMDGSLGILYPVESPYGLVTFRIATRGSFTSEQAVHATNVWVGSYESTFEPRAGWTYLFEIIYPENRIVVDYGQQDDLVLIGIVDNISGQVLSPDMAAGWTGPKASILYTGTLRGALSLPLRPGKEGMVLRSLMDGLTVKVKQPEYVELHRIVTNLNERTIWQRCVNVDTTLVPEISRREAVLDGIPDEWFDTVWSTADGFFREVNGRLEEVWGVYRQRPLVGWAAEREHRAYFAHWLDSFMDRKGWMYKAQWLCYDQKHDELREFLWKTIKPRGDSK